MYWSFFLIGYAELHQSAKHNSFCHRTYLHSQTASTLFHCYHATFTQMVPALLNPCCIDLSHQCQGHSHLVLASQHRSTVNPYVAYTNINSSSNLSWSRRHVTWRAVLYMPPILQGLAMMDLPPPSHWPATSTQLIRWNFHSAFALEVQAMSVSHHGIWYESGIPSYWLTCQLPWESPSIWQESLHLISRCIIVHCICLCAEGVHCAPCGALISSRWLFD